VRSGTAQTPAKPAAPGASARAALPTAAPGSLGFSPERLERLHKGMQALVDRHEVGGIVTLLVRDGKIADLKSYGWQDVASQKPMQSDTLFRIASMSKPITSVAIMMLYEEGRLMLTDPVSRYIPSFRDMKVLTRSAPNAEPTLVPARRQITIRDLLTHRSGLTYGFIDGGPVGDAYRKGGVSDGLAATEGTLAENIDRLAQAPLVSQPGAEWHYSLSTDVLGRVVEVVSGQPFDVFLRDRIFTPLKMTETAFDVPDAKWSRLATVYTPDGTNGVRAMKDPESFGNTHMAPGNYRAGKKYFSGGAGLVSTAHDYARFAQMLLNGGELDGVRLLSPKTVELMTVSHTSDLPANSTGAGTNWGLGFQVTTDLAGAQLLGSEGMYGWRGIYGSTFWVDPKARLIGVMMVQRYPGTPAGAPFQTLAYQALVR
jgi:CubicO group peptidase (beta-lactamase class C family)